jgi:elongation factor G
VKTFPTSKIRNVALVGHGGAGKTTLTEAILFTTGAIPRMGTVDAGNTVTDFDPEEHSRHYSVSLALAPVEFDGHKINLVDTPGYADFIADAVAALRIADLALFVVSAVDGVEVQTELLWRMAAAQGLPRAIVVTKMDKERASFSTVLDSLRSRFGAAIAPMEIPIGEESSFRGVVSLLDDEAYVYENGKPSATEIPAEIAEQEHTLHDALVEGIVVADEELMERYLMEDEISTAELSKTLGIGVAEGSVFPVLCCSSTHQVGIDRILRFLVDTAPAPAVAEGPAVATVYKTIVDPYVGKINLFKVIQGTVRPDHVLTNGRTLQDEKLHQLFTMRGKEQMPAAEVPSGDLGAVAKLAGTGTGDVLGERGAPVDVPPLELPQPTLPTAIRPKAKPDEDKLATALHRLLDEDPVLRREVNSETHQTVLWGMGETHLNIALEKLQRKFGVAIEQEPVRVPYRETILGNAEAEGKYKKQTGGHGQFGVAFLRVEPRGRGEGFEFVDAVVGGAIPRQFIPAVEKGVHETMERGGVHGFPVVDVRVTVYDGKYHPVDSSEMSFRTAASLGFREAMAKAQPILLEPISELVIVVPEAYQGDIMGDLNSKRGRVQGTAPVGDGEVEVAALVPTSEVLRYSIDLRSLTQGRGRFTAAHSHYDPLPAHLVDKVVADAKAAAESH